MKHLWKFAVVSSLFLLVTGCGSSGKADENAATETDATTQEKTDQSILTAVLEEDAVIEHEEDTQEKQVSLRLKEMVKVQGEFSPGTLVIHTLNADKINGDISALKKGTKIRLTTELMPPTTRSMPPQMSGEAVRKIDILD